MALFPCGIWGTCWVTSTQEMGREEKGRGGDERGRKRGQDERIPPLDLIKLTCPPAVRGPQLGPPIVFSVLPWFDQVTFVGFHFITKEKQDAFLPSGHIAMTQNGQSGATRWGMEFYSSPLPHFGTSTSHSSTPLGQPIPWSHSITQGLGPTVVSEVQTPALSFWLCYFLNVDLSQVTHLSFPHPKMEMVIMVPRSVQWYGG